MVRLKGYGLDVNTASQELQEEFEVLIDAFYFKFLASPLVSILFPLSI